MMSNNEEESQTEKITLEDVTEFGKKMGINSYSCTNNQYVKALLVFINKMYLNEIVADRMNLECLKILVGEPKEMLTLIEGIYDAWKITDKERATLKQNERQHQSKIREIKEATERNIQEHKRMTKNDRVLGAIMVGLIDSNIDNELLGVLRDAQYHLHG